MKRFLNRFFLHSAFSLFIPYGLLAQLSPPGLEGAKGVGWAAVGFSQRISNRWTTTWYLGGSEQTMKSISSLNKPAIFVINQETLYTFDSHWALTGAVSLRYQELYDENSPYDPKNPAWRKELRYYFRLFYRMTAGKSNLAFSFRPEYRVFYDTHGDRWATPAQQRYRFKGQINIPLNASKSNTLVIANEWLFASDELTTGWSQLHFTEDRLSTYVRHTFKKPALYLDLGIMHQLWKDKERQVHYTPYLSFDFIFINPFGTGKRKA